VRGVTKKGKEFFRFSSSLTEAIAHLRVADSHIWAGCQYVHNHFIEGADKGLYMAPDRIGATEVRCLKHVQHFKLVVLRQSPTFLNLSSAADTPASTIVPAGWC
jgi:hypothetical protein